MLREFGVGLKKPGADPLIWLHQAAPGLYEITQDLVDPASSALQHVSHVSMRGNLDGRKRRQVMAGCCVSHGMMVCAMATTARLLLLSACVNGANIQNQTVGVLGFRKRDAMTGSRTWIDHAAFSWRPDGLVSDWDYRDQLNLRTR